MNAKNITETLISDTDKLGKTVNVQALVVALVIIAAGVACFFLIGHDRFSASVDMLILLVGVALVVLGAVHAARKYNKVVYLPTNSAVAVAQFSMDAMSKKRVIDSLEKGVKCKALFPRACSMNATKLSIVASKQSYFKIAEGSRLLSVAKNAHGSLNAKIVMFR